MAFGGLIKIFSFTILLLCFVADSWQLQLNSTLTMTRPPNFWASRVANSTASQNQSLSITGGSAAYSGQFPFYVFLDIYDDPDDSSSGWYCGGTLIKTDIVLTTAWCLTGSIVQINVHLGMVAFSAMPAPTPISQYIYHQLYDDFTYSNDIGLIQLADPIKPSTTIKPIPIAPIPPVCGSEPTVMGFGVVDDSGANDEYLQKAVVSVMTWSSCNRFYYPLIDQHFCIESPSFTIIRRTCEGDRGNPIVMNGKLYGYILSDYDENDCMDDFPNLAMAVDYEDKWIKSTIASAKKGW